MNKCSFHNLQMHFNSFADIFGMTKYFSHEKVFFITSKCSALVDDSNKSLKIVIHCILMIINNC